MSYSAAKGRHESKQDDGGMQHLMCSAHNCPNLWSTSDGNLCRWHAEAPPHRWPEVTQDMHDHLTDRAQHAGFDKPAAKLLSNAEKAAILHRAKTILSAPKDPRAWIALLEAKERAGERLSPMQKHCLQQVRSV